MPNISKKTAYDVKEARNQSLSKSARKHYAENAQAASKDDSPMNKYGSHSPMNMGGSWMSKHCGQSRFGSPLNQGIKEEEAVMKSRQANYDAFAKPAQKFADKVDKYQKDGGTFNEEQASKVNAKLKKFNDDVNLRASRYNKSRDSINKVRTKRKKMQDESFNDLMN